MSNNDKTSLNISNDSKNNTDNCPSKYFSMLSNQGCETSAFKEYQDWDSNIKSISNLETDTNILYCSCCSSTVEINFINKEEIYLKCKNGWKKINISDIQEYFHENNIKMNKDENIYNLYCRRHKDKNIFHKYEKYCVSCNINLCEDCNFIKRCENHDYINLNLEKTLKNYIDNYILNNSKTDDENEKNLCKLLKVLLQTNEEFPNFATLKSLENAYEFLSDKDKIKEKITFKNEIIETKIEENKDAKKEGKCITIMKHLKKNLKEAIIEEVSMDKKNFNNLKFLCKHLSKNKNIQFLTKLVLIGNNIKSIKYFVKSKSALIYLLI